MLHIKDTVYKLNSLIKSTDFNEADFKCLFDKITMHEGISFHLVDCEFCNEQSISIIRKLKNVLANKKNFEGAAHFRSIELELIKNTDNLKSLNLKYSSFIFSENELKFYYLGSGSNDFKIKSLLTINSFK